MPRAKRPASPFDSFDEDYDEDGSSSSSKNGNPPIQRNAANARERARMRVLSSAFGRLKTKLPNIPPDTKLSKLDTLRLATIYIKQLKTLVEGGGVSNAHNNGKIDEPATECEAFNFQYTSQSMTWPFTFQHIHAASRQSTSHCSPMEWNGLPEPEKNIQNSESFQSISHNRYQSSNSSITSALDNNNYSLSNTNLISCHNSKNNNNNNEYNNNYAFDNFYNQHNQYSQRHTQHHHHNGVSQIH